MDLSFIAAVKFFHENAGGIVGERMRGAMALARAERRATAEGLRVLWEDEQEPWDGEPPAPPILVCGNVPEPGGWRGSLASLGMVGFNSWRDTYVRVVEAELFVEAFATLDARREAAACAEASELAARATYAGPVLS